MAVIDSGISAWHDDLSEAVNPSQCVDRFVDFVGGSATPSDEYGHGTHVAGIIAGNGFDSGGARSGIAPASRLVVLKVLDGSGRGRISRDCGVWLRRHAPDRAEHPRCEPVRGDRGIRVLQLRSADARREARG